jgi:hypothetical protein
MNAPNRLEAIRLAQERIHELEQEISVLRQDEGIQRELDFAEKLSTLMKKFNVKVDEVIALLEIRGDLDRKVSSCETTYRLKHVLGLKEVEAAHRAEKPLRLTR